MAQQETDPHEGTRDAWAGPAAGGSGGYPAAARPSANSRTLASVAHLSALTTLIGLPGVLGPLIVLLAAGGDDAYVAAESREALNFNLSALIYVVAGAVLSVPLLVVTLGLGALVLVPAALVAAVAWIVLVVIGGVRAADGGGFRYPLTIRFLR